MLGRAILFAAVAAATAAAVQERQTFRSAADLVQVDVSVLDKDRRPVRGLTAADFTIFEDGKPRPVVAFVPVELASRESYEGRASWMRDVAPDVIDNNVRPEGRLVVIMFDWSIRFHDQQLARRIATAAVDQLGPDDLAAVVFTNANSNGGAPQNFTADRSRLLAAINRPFAVALINAPVGPTKDPRNGNFVMLDDPEGYESGECNCRTCVAETIARVADAVRDVQGRRKTLLFIGTYFRLSEGLQGPVNKAPKPTSPMSITGIVPMNPNIMACAQPLRDAREAMLRATAAANLTIHTIDPVGIETSMNSPLGGSDEGQQVRRDELTSLADLTGGRAIMNTETPETKIPALFGESQSHYLLAFAPADAKGAGKFHKLSVKVSRPQVDVHTRAGYYAGDTPGGARASSVIAPQTASAVGGVLPRRDLPLSVSAAPFALPGRAESAVAVVLGVRQPLPAPGDTKNPVNVLAAAFDRDGKSVQSETKTLAVTWRADASGTMAYELLSRLTLKPGRYELRLAVDASANQRGSVYTYVDVPGLLAAAVVAVRDRARRGRRTLVGAEGRLRHPAAARPDRAPQLQRRRSGHGVRPHLRSGEETADFRHRHDAHRRRPRHGSVHRNRDDRHRSLRLGARRGPSGRATAVDAGQG